MGNLIRVNFGSGEVAGYGQNYDKKEGDDFFKTVVDNVDKYCRNNYPITIPKGLFPIVRSFFDSSYRRRVMAEINRENVCLPIFYVMGLEESGAIKRLGEFGFTFHNVIDTLMGRDEYKNAKEAEKLETLVRSFELVRAKGIEDIKKIYGRT